MNDSLRELNLEVENRDELNFSTVFKVKLTAKSNFKKYYKNFSSFKEAFEFVENQKKDPIWLRVTLIEIRSREIDPDFYATIYLTP